jgi:hypothetical protein
MTDAAAAPLPAQGWIDFMRSCHRGPGLPLAVLQEGEALEANLPPVAQPKPLLKSAQEERDRQ